jgi:hypothetical protein
VHVLDGRVIDLDRPSITLSRDSGAGLASTLQ